MVNVSQLEFLPLFSICARKMYFFAFGAKLYKTQDKKQKILTANNPFHPKGLIIQRIKIKLSWKEC